MSVDHVEDFNTVTSIHRSVRNIKLPKKVKRKSEEQDQEQNHSNPHNHHPYDHPPSLDEEGHIDGYA